MRFIVRCLALAGALLGTAVPGCRHARAQAPALQVSPISIEMLPGQMTATLDVTNTGTQPTTVQLRPFQWRPADTGDGLDDTETLQISPPITEIGPGETQVFRLVLLAPATAHEECYRLLLDQLPPPSSPGSVRIF